MRFRKGTIASSSVAKATPETGEKPRSPLLWLLHPETAFWVPIVTTAVAVPAAASVTDVGLIEHVGNCAAVAPLVRATVQVRATDPAKELCEVRVAVVVPVAAFAAVTAVVIAGAAIVKVGPVTVAVTIAVVETAVEEPVAVPVAVTVARSEPAVPEVTVNATTAVPVPPEVNVTAVGVTVQLPAALPVTFATAQVSPTLPANPFTEVKVTVLAELVVVPEVTAIVEGEAVIV